MVFIIETLSTLKMGTKSSRGILTNLYQQQEPKQIDVIMQATSEEVASSWFLHSYWTYKLNYFSTNGKVDSCIGSAMDWNSVDITLYFSSQLIFERYHVLIIT